MKPLLKDHERWLEQTLPLWRDLVALAWRQPNPSTLNLFPPQVGWCYRGDLMLVGKCPNKWLDLPDMAGIESALAAPAECPMESLVERHWRAPKGDYAFGRSQFWTFARRIESGLSGRPLGSPGWSSSLLWSNLYRVAPNDGLRPHGTVADSERAFQLDACVRLLAAEIDVYRPRRILLTTGPTWADPFAERLGWALSPHPASSWVVASGNTPGGAKVVVCVHPMLKPDPQGGAEEVLASLR